MTEMNYAQYDAGNLAGLLDSIRSAVSGEIPSLIIDFGGLEMLIKELESNHYYISYLEHTEKQLRAELARFQPVYDEMPKRSGTIKHWIKTEPPE